MPETERLRICPFSAEDFDPWYACAGDRETARMLGGDFPKDETEAHALFSEMLKQGRFYAIRSRRDGTYLGHISVSDPYPPVRALTSLTGRTGCSLAYCVVKEHRRQGVAAEAVAAMVRWLFQEKGCDFVNCGYYEYNAPSAALQKKLGFFELCTHYHIIDGERVRVVENIRYRPTEP